MKDIVDELARDFSSQTHGSSSFDKDDIFVKGKEAHEFVPMSYLTKQHSEEMSLKGLQAAGYVVSSCDFIDLEHFDEWFQNSFKKKLTQKKKKESMIVHYPDVKKIHEAVEIVNEVYKIFKDFLVLNNGKNLPVQLGEWYAKSILGLKQVKSSSQRGFDFYTEDDKRVEVKIHWQDHTSPKGVKLKKSMVELADYVVVMYVAKNFTIRDILLLDSSFVTRKFAGKGHTVFLKDQDVGSYFFSKSTKHYDKIVNKASLLKFASPGLAIKIDENIRKAQKKTSAL